MENNDEPKFVDQPPTKMSWFKKIIMRRKEVRHDLKYGIVHTDELASPWFIKIVLVNLLAITAQVILLTLIGGVMYDDWDAGIFFACMSVIVGPFLVGILSKYIIDDYDLRLREKRKEIVDLAKCVDKKDIEISTIRSENRINIAELKLEHVEETSQLKIALKVKEKMSDLK